MKIHDSVFPVALSVLCLVPTTASAAAPASAPASAPAPAPASAPAPAPAPAASSEDARAEAAAQYSGRATADAGFYFSAFGGTAVVMSAIYTKCGSTDTTGVCAPGVGLGLAAGGLVNMIVGLPLLISGSKRVKDPAAWIARRPGRRARMLAKANAKGIEVPSPQGSARIDKGRRQSRAGSFTLIASGFTLGLGAGVAPLLPGAGIGFNVAGVGLLATGIGLAVGGKRKTFLPERDGARSSISVMPTLVVSPAQRTLPGAGVSGRF